MKANGEGGRIMDCLICQNVIVPKSRIHFNSSGYAV
jgi:hypothetical protein